MIGGARSGGVIIVTLGPPPKSSLEGERAKGVVSYIFPPLSRARGRRHLIIQLKNKEISPGMILKRQNIYVLETAGLVSWVDGLLKDGLASYFSLLLSLSLRVHQLKHSLVLTITFGHPKERRRMFS